MHSTACENASIETTSSGRSTVLKSIRVDPITTSHWMRASVRDMRNLTDLGWPPDFSPLGQPPASRQTANAAFGIAVTIGTLRQTGASLCGMPISADDLRFLIPSESCLRVFALK